MPEGRPFKTVVFLHRDEKHFAELTHLNSSVVLHTGEPQLDLSPDLITSYAAQTGLVTKSEIRVGVLNRGKYLITLPQGLSPETFIQATPVEIWDLRFHFQQWTALDEAAIIIPSFKVLIALEDLPPYIWREDYVLQAVTGMGTYLGSIDPPDPTDLKQYLVVIATDDLNRIPQHVGLRVGGLEHLLSVKVLKISMGIIYGPKDLPQMPKKYGRPEQLYSSPDSSEEEMGDFRDDMIPVSRKALTEICQGRDPATLPEIVRSFLAGDTTRAPLGNEAHATENPVIAFPRQTTHVSQTATVTQTVSVSAVQSPEVAVARNMENQMPRNGGKNVAGLTAGQSDPPQPDSIKTSHTGTLAPNPSLSGHAHPLRILQHNSGEAGHRVTHTTANQGREIGGGKQTILEGPSNPNGESHLPQRVRTRPSTTQLADETRRPSKDKTSTSVGKGQGRLWGKRGVRVTQPNTRTAHVAHNKTKLGEPSNMRQKRKAVAQTQKTVGPAKRTTDRASKNKEVEDNPKGRRAQCALRESGLYEVQVNYTHSLNIADSTGVDLETVLQSIQEDNLQRTAQADAPHVQAEEELVDHSRRFDPDTEDELDYEFE